MRPRRSRHLVVQVVDLQLVAATAVREVEAAVLLRREQPGVRVRLQSNPSVRFDIRVLSDVGTFLRSKCRLDLDSFLVTSSIFHFQTLPTIHATRHASKMLAQVAPRAVAENARRDGVEHAQRQGAL